jgi:flagellar hook-associated protein 1 FlgK
MVSVTLGGVSLVTAQDIGTASPAVNTGWAQSISAAAPTDVGGTLGALLNLGGTAIAGAPAGQIDGYLSQLDGLAGQLADAVNNPTVGAGTSSAYAATLDPPFFTGDTASTIAVGVTASQVQTTDGTNTGDSDLATAIAGLSGGAPDQAYGAFVAQVGSDTQTANTQASTQQALATAIGNQRQGVEGVDLNQEEATIIQEQQAYQACAQVMNTFNTMISSLIQAVG